MATTPSIPTGFWVTQGNGHAFVQWSIVPGATGYVVQRSTDQINYATIATLTTQLSYLDTGVTIGTSYYYQVAASSVSGSHATASLTLNANPTNGDTFSLGNIVFTVGTDFILGASPANTATNIVVAINSNALLYPSVVTASSSGNIVTLVAANAGLEGNAIQFSQSLLNVDLLPFSLGTNPVYSPFTTPQNVVPTTSGEMSLGELRARSQQRADRFNSNFLTLAEWNSNINQSLFELYDLLIDVYEDYFLDYPPVQFTTNGSQANFPLPDGVNTSFVNGLTGGALPSAPPAFYKLWGADLAANTSPTGWVTIAKFMPLDRNKYFYPNSQSTIYGVFNMQYRVLGMSQISFIPIPSGTQYVRLWYYPRMTMLLADSDVTQYLGVSGWLEYVIVDAAIKALRKEQGWDTSALERDKAMLKVRIEAAAKNKDQGRPDVIQDSRYANGMQGYGGPGWTPGGGY